MPATMVRGSASPMSTFMCMSLSEFLTRSANFTRPTRRSTLAKSSTAIFWLAGSAGSGFLPSRTFCSAVTFSSSAEQDVLFGGDLFFQRPHGRDSFLQIDAREDGCDFADL